jgi:hypothetical protein
LLSHPHPKAPLALVTYVSDVAISASLQHKCDGHWKTPGFFSRKFNSTETSYCTYEQEILAISVAIELWKVEISSSKGIIKPLVYAFTLKLDKANQRRLKGL